MSLDTIEDKIRNREYLTLESISQDMHLIVHNSTIYNGSFNKLTNTAKKLFKLFKKEINEIEVCSDCYMNYMNSISSIQLVNVYEKNFWFSELCVSVYLSGIQITLNNSLRLIIALKKVNFYIF